MPHRRRSEKSIARIRFIPVFLAVFLCGPALSAPQKGLSPEKRHAIERAVASFMSANSIPGLSAALVLDGKPCWSQGFGMADLENYSPATSETLFRLGSFPSPSRQRRCSSFGSAASWI